MVKWIVAVKIQPNIFLDNWGKPWKKPPVRLVSTGIWTRDLPNTSQVCYHWATSLGKIEYFLLFIQKSIVALFFIVLIFNMSIDLLWAVPIYYRIENGMCMAALRYERLYLIGQWRFDVMTSRRISPRCCFACLEGILMILEKIGHSLVCHELSQSVPDC